MAAEKKETITTSENNLQSKSEKSTYKVIKYFMDAEKAGVSYNAGDFLPSDISDTRIKIMLDNNLIEKA